MSIDGIDLLRNHKPWRGFPWLRFLPWDIRSLTPALALRNGISPTISSTEQHLRHIKYAFRRTSTTCQASRCDDNQQNMTSFRHFVIELCCLLYCPRSCWLSCRALPWECQDRSPTARWLGLRQYQGLVSLNDPTTATLRSTSFHSHTM